MGMLILIFGAPGIKSGESFGVRASGIPFLWRESSRDGETLCRLRAAFEKPSYVLKCRKSKGGDISSDKKILNNSVF